MARPKKNQDGAAPVKTAKTVVPIQTLHQIGEFSPKGYFLITIGENDEFVINYTAQNDMVALAMVKFIANHAGAMDDAHSAAIQNRIFPDDEDKELGV